MCECWVIVQTNPTFCTAAGRILQLVCLEPFPRFIRNKWNFDDWRWWMVLTWPESSRTSWSTCCTARVTVVIKRDVARSAVGVWSAGSPLEGVSSSDGSQKTRVYVRGLRISSAVLVQLTGHRLRSRFASLHDFAARWMFWLVHAGCNNDEMSAECLKQWNLEGGDDPHFPGRCFGSERVSRFDED